MEVLAVTKGVRMSPLKVRAVARQIQGMHALEAQALLASVPRKSARLVSKTLKSAMANAENIADEWDAEELQGRIAELEQKVSSTNNKKTRRSSQAKIDAYQSFLDSPHKLEQTMLYIKEATVGDAPTMKRWRPRARGSASPILKRSCHIRIVLTDQI
ncbi:MAG: large ribosomal subunit protein uL22 [Limisphaerales bacterium]|jgi:large subunit ribosomal protein L22|nr:50S ribosomal protein L22 [Verrucomicrobiales bacterium]MDP6338144.1 uL22 family ribosomal protein [Verrucomicrobiota bacterium]HBT22775.1 50S ribosomal protein L22 [Verrucomicrobiales bacterium]